MSSDSGRRALPWAGDAAAHGSHDPAGKTQNQTDREISSDENRDPEPEEEDEIRHLLISVGESLTLGDASGIQHKAVAHVAAPQPLDRLVDPFHRQALHLWADVVAYAELHHLQQAGR